VWVEVPEIFQVFQKFATRTISGCPAIFKDILVTKYGVPNIHKGVLTGCP
jgi:hypothetical protein